MSDDVAIKFSWGKAWLDEEHGISRVDFVPGTQQDLRAAQEQIAALTELLKGKPRPYLVDLRNVKSTNHEARKYFAGRESKAVWNAAALLTGSPLSNAIGNLWLAANNSRGNPVKLFTNEADAIAWLKTFRK